MARIPDEEIERAQAGGFPAAAGGSAGHRAEAARRRPVGPGKPGPGKPGTVSANPLGNQGQR